MKRLSLFCGIIIGLFLLLIVTSCLKDKAYENGSIQSVHGSTIKAIEIGLNVATVDQFISYAYNNSNNDTTVQLIRVVLATNAPASEDIHVTLTRNDSLINKYDTLNQANLVPSNAYTVLNNGVVTIPKGTNVGFLSIKFKPSDLLGISAAAGFYISKIAESGYVISGNIFSGVAGINIKNKYDGAYTATGKFTDMLNGTITDMGVYPEQIYLVTQTGNSVAFFDVNTAKDFAHAINSGGLTTYGGFAPTFVFDLGTNIISSVTNYYGQNSGSRKRSARLDITGVNALSGTPGAVGSTIKVKYVLVQGGVDRTFFDETFTYTGPRP